jgi:hypothetical protein
MTSTPDLRASRHVPVVADEDPVVETTSPPPGVVQRWAPLWRPAAIFVASRIATLMAMATAAALVPPMGLPKLGIRGVMGNTWDSGWYRDLAQFGYPQAVVEGVGDAAQSRLAFFPLYPITIRFFHGLGLPYDIAALLVSALAGLAAAILLWRLIARFSGPAAADRGVALFSFFPGAMVLSLAYSEALLLALAIGCLVALVEERWVLAGVLAALATATRPNGIALVAACAFAASMAVVRRRQWRALVAPALAPMGLLAFFVYLARHTGDFGAWIRTERQGWGQETDPIATFHILSDFVHRPFADNNIAIVTAGTVFAVVALALFLRSRPPGVILVYTLSVMGLALLSEAMGMKPRFLLTAFPLVTVFGQYLTTPIAFSALVGFFATGMGCFTIICMVTQATP